MRLRKLFEGISSERNLLTNYEDTLLAMAEIEGEAWLNRQLESGSGEYDVQGALKQVLKWRERSEEDERDLAAAIDPEEIAFLQRSLEHGNDITSDAIYGAGGWDRWFVRMNGDVIFSNMHGSDRTRKQAKELGFELF